MQAYKKTQKQQQQALYTHNKPQKQQQQGMQAIKQSNKKILKNQNYNGSNPCYTRH